MFSRQEHCRKIPHTSLFLRITTTVKFLGSGDWVQNTGVHQKITTPYMESTPSVQSSLEKKQPPIGGDQHSTSSDGSTTTKTSSFFGLVNQEQLSNFATSLRTPSDSIFINVALVLFYAINQFGNLYGWVSYQSTGSLEGVFGSWFAKVLTTPYSFAITLLGYQLSALLLVFVMILQALTIILVFLGYNLLLRG